MGNTFKYLLHVDLLTRFITKKFRLNPEWTEAVVRRCSVKKMSLEIFQDSQENTCARVSFFNKVACLSPATLLKKSLWYRCLPVNFAKFLRTHFFTEHLRTTASEWTICRIGEMVIPFPRHVFSCGWKIENLNEPCFDFICLFICTFL